MKIISKKITLSIIILFCLIIFSQIIYAYIPITTDWPDGDDSVDKVENVAKDMWATIIVVVQILAVGAVVFAGLRYMFSSADVRADIKKEMLYLALGAILVFSTTTIIQFVVDTSNELLN